MTPRNEEYIISWECSWSTAMRSGAYAPVCIRWANVTFSDNVNPHLAWKDCRGTRSLVVICHDFDVPSRGDDVNKDDREIPADLPRVDFFHWVLVDLPPEARSIAEGEHSRGFTAGGKSGPSTLRGARHGLNDYTGWFAGDAQMAGQYFGYDGPFPPFNDSLVHHYVFTLYALSVSRLPLGRIHGAADSPHCRARCSAARSQYHTLNRRLLHEEATHLAIRHGERRGTPRCGCGQLNTPLQTLGRGRPTGCGRDRRQSIMRSAGDLDRAMHTALPLARAVGRFVVAEPGLRATASSVCSTPRSIARPIRRCAGECATGVRRKW
jgi:phosphatidylethanolamine-binding protein (PEBP) family uncharacterized protein